MTDWFRRESWTREDEREFFARLSRSRTEYIKAQYLRIQAVHLASTGRRSSILVALDLIDRLLREYPEPSQVACALWQQAQCHEALNDVDAAIVSFRNALDAERRFPKYATGAALDLAWLIANRKLRHLYDEALVLVDEHRPSISFPVDEFRIAAIRALIAGDHGDRAVARQFATVALTSAERTTSGLQYHKSVGLVGERYQDVVAQMQQWAVA